MRVQGIGGVFLYARDAAALAAWYGEQLGLSLNPWGASFGIELPSADLEPAGRRATTTFAIFQADAPLPEGLQTARLNWRVDDLDAALDLLRAAGAPIEEQREESAYGRFGWARDPEGNRIELWQPPLASEGSPEES